MTALVPFDLIAWLEKNAPEEPKAARPKQLARTSAPRGNSLSRYLMSALADEVARVADAPDGERNDQLNKSAFALGQLVPCGLSRGDVERQLTAAAEVVKLPLDEVFKTINSGINAGILEPRDLSHVGQPVARRETHHEKNGHATPNGDGHHADDGTTTGEPDWAKMGQEAADQHARDEIAKHGLPAFANYAWEDGEPDEKGNVKQVKVALSMLGLSDLLETIVGKWPKRVGETIFTETWDHEPVYLTSPARLFAWLAQFAQVDWARGSQFIGQEQFHEHLRMTAERYEAIETLPHWPPLPGIFYLHRPVPAPGGKLEGLVDSFSPATDEDRELIKAMILTPFWGGEPGQKPAMLITGPDHDEERGRGIGKTTLLDLLFDGLLDGSLDVSPSSDMEKVKTRMLSASGRHCRAARIDNIKTLKLSWDELEKIITCPTISGHAMYEGEGRRPNTLVWGLTLNGASLSTDMAQRCVVIKLGRPRFEAGWKERVRKYIADNRWEIIADVGAILETASGPLTPKTRWASWERGVLSRVNLAEACQRLIAERMMEADSDHEDKEVVADHFRQMLTLFHHDPNNCHVFIPSKVAGEWLADACQEKRPTNRATTYLGGLGIPELRKSKKGQPGWAWTGPKTERGITAVWFDRRQTNGDAY